MSSSEEEQIYSIALTMVPGIGHIGAKHLIDGMNNAVDIFRLRKEIPERIPEVSQRVVDALDCPQAVIRAEQEYEFIRKNRISCLLSMTRLILLVCGNVKMLLLSFSLKEIPI